MELENRTAGLLDFFYSLQGDVVRHNDVMQLLLGEEVLEFVEWPLQDQEAHSIPALKEELRVLQEEMRSHEELGTGGGPTDLIKLLTTDKLTSHQREHQLTFLNTASTYKLHLSTCTSCCEKLS